MDAPIVHPGDNPFFFSLLGWSDLGKSFWDRDSASKHAAQSSRWDWQGRSKGTKKENAGVLRGDCCPAHQIRIGPVALQGCGDFANNQVIHLLGGFWIVSGEAKKQSPVTQPGLCPSFPAEGAQREENQCLGIPGLPRLAHETPYVMKSACHSPFLGGDTD